MTSSSKTENEYSGEGKRILPPEVTKVGFLSRARDGELHASALPPASLGGHPEALKGKPSAYSLARIKV